MYLYVHVYVTFPSPIVLGSATFQIDPARPVLRFCSVQFETTIDAVYIFTVILRNFSRLFFISKIIDDRARSGDTMCKIVCEPIECPGTGTRSATAATESGERGKRCSTEVARPFFSLSLSPHTTRSFDFYPPSFRQTTDRDVDRRPRETKRPL